MSRKSLKVGYLNPLWLSQIIAKYVSFHFRASLSVRKKGQKQPLLHQRCICVCSITKAFLNKFLYSGLITSEQSRLVNDYLFDERFSLNLRCIFCHGFNDWWWFAGHV